MAIVSMYGGVRAHWLPVPGEDLPDFVWDNLVEYGGVEVSWSVESLKKAMSSMPPRPVPVVRPRMNIPCRACTPRDRKSPCQDCGKVDLLKWGRCADCIEERKEKSRARWTEKTCPECGNKFMPAKKTGPSPIYCSSGCKYLHKNPPKWKTFNCFRCRKDFTVYGNSMCSRGMNGRKPYCSKKCRELSHLKYDGLGPSVDRICAQCGKRFKIEFNGKKRVVGCWTTKKYCSKKCQSRSRLSTENFKAHRLAAKIRRTRQINESAIEKISREEIFRRDGYRCQKCGKKTRPNWNVMHRLYPCLDHIIPLAKGGKHERTNVRCLCRGCNMSKGSRVKNEQLLIIG